MGTEYKVMAITPKREEGVAPVDCFPFGTKLVGQ